MSITDQIKTLREKTGAPVIECRNALVETGCDTEKARELLLKRGLARAEQIAEKKQNREVSQGIIEAYVHPGCRIGVLVEVNCESDFVARTQEFKELAHDLALQVAAASPTYISAQDIPEGEALDAAEVCLLSQPFIKDPQKPVEERVKETIARVGENIKVKRFARFELGV